MDLEPKGAQQRATGTHGGEAIGVYSTATRITALNDDKWNRIRKCESSDAASNGAFVRSEMAHPLLTA
jgi:hypothetical protein